MVEVSSSTYDPDGDVTATTEYVDSNPADGRTSLYGYDWQDRQVFAVNPPGAQGNVTYTTTTYDNLGEPTETQTFLEASPGTVAPATDQLLAQSTTACDTLGQVYESSTYVVSGGSVASTQTTDTWYDADGNTVALEDPDANVTTWAYDALGDQTQSTVGQVLTCPSGRCV